MLEGGEVVLASAPVTQRLWWDYYRRTYGLLIATDRRLLFLGVPPEPLLHRDAGPRELVDVSFRYARGVGVRRSPGRRGMQVALASGSQREVIEGSGRDADALASVLDSMDARIAGLRAASDAERRAVEAAAAASRRAAYHLVQPGEALDAIARRYGTTTDSLLTWNNLTTSRIVAGQRLLVRPATTS